MYKRSHNSDFTKTNSPGRSIYILSIIVGLGVLFLASSQLFNDILAQTASHKDSPDKLAKNGSQVLVDTSTLPDAAQRQIAALLAEKNGRTPQQRKMDSRLIRAIKESRHEAFAPGADNMRPVNLAMDGFDNVVLELKVTTTDRTFPQRLKAAGVTIVLDMSQYQTIKVKVPLSKVEALANFPEVLFIQPAIKAQLEQSPYGIATTATSSLGSNTPTPSANTSAPVTNNSDNNIMIRSGKGNNPPEGVNSVTQKPNIQSATGKIYSQGDTAHRAAIARTMFNTAGAGVKIGILSDSFNIKGGAPTDITTGNLPGVGNPNGNLRPVTVLQEGPATGSDEGRAMLQIVHNIAPQAQLFFATAANGAASFAANIQALRTAGCDIIIDDVAYFNESPFQDGLIAQAVNTVTANGALYFASAGNAGSLKKATAGVWQGDFTDGGALANLPGGTVNNFTLAGTPTLADAVVAGGSPCYTLFWSDPLGASNNDYDIFIFNSTLTTLLDFSTNSQTGTQDPFEIAAGGTFAGDRVVIFKTTSAATRALHLNTNRGRLAIATNGQARGHNSAVNAFSVAATPVGSALSGGNAFSAANSLEAFSSDGPRRVFYNADGTPITPGNLLFSTAGGMVRNKPDITAADGVSTTLAANSGLNPLFGTSAAASHAGAIAALVKSANPTLTPAQIRSILTSSTIDIEAVGYDNNAGFGIIDTINALQASKIKP